MTSDTNHEARIEAGKPTARRMFEKLSAADIQGFIGIRRHKAPGGAA